MDLQELKISLLDMEKRLDDIKDNVLSIESKKIRLDEIDKKLSKEEVWSDLELSQKLSKEKNKTRNGLFSNSFYAAAYGFRFFGDNIVF